MKTSWTQHIKDPAEKETFQVSVRSSAHVLERLAEILCDKLEADAKSSKEDYHAPAWAYRQADKVGYARALQEVIDLTKVTK
jgi:hypothetical protein